MPGQALKTLTSELATTLLETLAEGVFAIDSEGCVIYINPAAEQMLGYEPGELLFKNGHDTFHYRHADGAPLTREECLLIRALSTGETLRGFEDTLTRKNGSTFPARCSSSPIIENGQVVGATQSFDDISDEKKSESQFRSAILEAQLANDKRNEFLAIMSHELRTPLNAIIGYSTMLQKGLAGILNEKQEQYAKNVTQAGSHLLTLVNDLLDAAQVDSKQLAVKPQRIELKTMLIETRDMLTEIAEKAEVTLVFETDKAPTYITVDPGRFKQILINLVGNAVKFNRPKGKVYIRFFRSSDHQKLVGEVEDTGIGIPQSKLNLLFQKFYQVDASNIRAREGTGLGLALTRDLIEHHGGTITVESIENQGACFRFELPLDERAEST